MIAFIESTGMVFVSWLPHVLIADYDNAEVYSVFGPMAETGS